MKNLTLRINITREILIKSKNCPSIENSTDDCIVGQNCAIALAIRDIFPEANVGPYDISLLGTDCIDYRNYEVDLPKKSLILLMNLILNLQKKESKCNHSPLK